MRVERIGEATNAVCEECQTAFRVKPYRVGKARFCSFACGGRFHARTRLNTGSKAYMRGNQLRKGLRPTNAFKSEDVRGAASKKWKDGLSLVCQRCGVDFRQKPWVARQNGVARFCSKACFTASGCFQGERSSTYVGGATTYRGRGWLIARAEVVADQEGCCDSCGKVCGHSLPVHHIRPFREFATAAEANARSNLIGLCQSCHMKEESTFRAPEPKPEQLSLLK